MNQLRKIKLSFYLYKFFSDFIFIYPYYAIMMNENGVSNFQFSILMVIWIIPIIIFEIPSGIISDKYNRKLVIMFGQAIRITGYLSWAIFPNIISYAFGFVCWGFASSLRSGALEALIYDNLLKINKEDQYARINSNGLFLSSTSIVLVTLFASLLVKNGFNILIYLSIVSLIICMTSLIFVKDVRVQQNEVNLDEVKFIDMMIIGYKNIIKNKKILYIILIGNMFMFAGLLDEYWGLLLKDIDFNYETIGHIIILVMILEALSMLIIPKVEKFNKYYIILFIGGFLLTITYFIHDKLLTIFFIAIFNSTFKVFNNITDIKFQYMIKSNIRSTITSFKGLIDEIFCVLYYMMIGIISSEFTLPNTFVICGGILIMFSIIIKIVKHNNEEVLQ